MSCFNLDILSGVHQSSQKLGFYPFFSTVAYNLVMMVDGDVSEYLSTEKDFMGKVPGCILMVKEKVEINMVLKTLGYLVMDIAESFT